MAPPPRHRARAAGRHHSTNERGGVEGWLDAIGWKHIFFLLAAYVILRPFLQDGGDKLGHPHGVPTIASILGQGKERHPIEVVGDVDAGGQHARRSKGGRGGERKGNKKQRPLSGSVEDGVVEWEGPEPRVGAEVQQVEFWLTQYQVVS